MDELNGKIVIVTGGASGIGRALCLQLGRIGANVTVADVNAEGAQDVAANIRENGGQAHAEQIDVTNSEEVKNIIDKTCADHGRIDYIFNNAGILIVGETYDMGIEDWNHILDVNLKGVIYGTTIAYTAMVKQGFGHIVNMSSYQGLIPSGAATAYVTTKHGVVGLSTSLHSEAAQFGVKISVVCPGFIDTPLFRTADVLNADHASVFSKIPFKLMDTRDAAKAILSGVIMNKKIIIFPFYARFFWWLYRINPLLASPLVDGLIKSFRTIKRQT